MTVDQDVVITPVPTEAFDLQLDGEAYRFVRAADRVSVTAFGRSGIVEELSSIVTPEGRNVVVRDRNGLSAEYAERSIDGLLQVSVIAGGVTREVLTSLDDYADTMTRALDGVSLPLLYRIPRLAREVRDNATFREQLRGTVQVLATHGGPSTGCESACTLAVKSVLSPGVEAFALGFCTACVVHGW
jgi:hypothetical protein